MAQPRKVVIIIIQVIVKPLIRLRQERVLKEEMRRQRVVDHRVGAAREVRIDWELRRKFGFSLTLLDDGRESTFGLRLAVRLRVACDVGRAGDRNVFIVVVKVVVVLGR